MKTYNPFKVGSWVRYKDIEGQVNERHGDHLIIVTEGYDMFAVSRRECEPIISHISKEELRQEIGGRI